jgi:hypothetical protein
VETDSARARRELDTVAAAIVPWRAHSIGQDLAVVIAPVATSEPRRDHG